MTSLYLSGVAHINSLALLYNGWSPIMTVFCPRWLAIALNQFITVVIVLFSSAGAYGMGSIPAIVSGWLPVEPLSLNPLQDGIC